MEFSYLLLLEIVAIILIAAALLTWRMNVRRRNVWRNFARRNGMRYRTGDNGPVIEGKQRDRRVTWRLTSDSSDHGTLGFEEVRIDVELKRSPPADMEVMKAPGIVGSVIRAVEDEPRIGTSDQDFDHAFVVKAPSPDPALEYLSEPRRRILVNLANESATAALGIERGVLFWQERNMVSTEEDLVTRTQHMLDAAEQLDSANDEAHPFAHSGVEAKRESA